MPFKLADAQLDRGNLINGQAKVARPNFKGSCYMPFSGTGSGHNIHTVISILKYMGNAVLASYQVLYC